MFQILRPSISSSLSFQNQAGLSSIIQHQKEHANNPTSNPNPQTPESKANRRDTNPYLLIHLITPPHNPAVSPRRPRQPSLNIPLNPPLHLRPNPLFLTPPSPLLGLKIRIIPCSAPPPFIRGFTRPKDSFRNPDSGSTTTGELRCWRGRGGAGFGGRGRGGRD